MVCSIFLSFFFRRRFLPKLDSLHYTPPAVVVTRLPTGLSTRHVLHRPRGPSFIGPAADAISFADLLARWLDMRHCHPNMSPLGRASLGRASSS